MSVRAPIYDTLSLTFAGQNGAPTLRHHWRIVQPPPSVAFSLRGRIGAALGPAADLAVREALRALDPGAEDDLAADSQTVGEALALRAWRRARTGQALAEVGDGAPAAVDVLRAVLAFVAGRSGVRLDSALFGEHEREEGGGAGYRWTRPALLHRLLLDSRLGYEGDSERPRTRPWLVDGEPDSPGRRYALAVAEGRVGPFVAALDDVLVSADELGLLAAWAVLHLWRPF